MLPECHLISLATESNSIRLVNECNNQILNIPLEKQDARLQFQRHWLLKDGDGFGSGSPFAS